MAEDGYFFAEQDARLVRNAEQYYRGRFGAPAESWNLHDGHVMETLHALLAWTAKGSGGARAVVWFDAVLHIDTTSALQPFERGSRHEADLLETFPTGV